MRKKILILFIFFINTFLIFSINYITTAESISWSGAYTSVADGFEAMLYNPAGLDFSKTRYGFNIFGSYGIRFFSNSMTSDQVIKMLLTMQAEENLSDSGVLDKILYFMPETGMTMGLDMSAMNVMTYFKLENFSLGISFIPKSSAYTTIDKGVFNNLFNEIDLTETIDYKTSATIFQYLDFNVVLSKRVTFLEKLIPVEGIYAGLTGHLYFPTLYVKNSARVKMGPGNPNPVTGIIDNYKLNTKGDLVVGSNGLIVGLLRNVPIFNELGHAILDHAGSPAFGFGFDAGFLIKFNRFVRMGFAITDLGLIVFPITAKVSIDIDTVIGLDNIANFRDEFIDDLIGEIVESDGTWGNTEIYMPPTAIRLGVALTPFKNEIFMWASDISVSDFNNLLNNGYPTFNISSGIEFNPGYQWFHVPMRLAVCYNTQSNFPSFSAGIGLYLGPVEMEIGIKGLEFLISGWGAREVCAGFDFKFEF